MGIGVCVWNSMGKINKVRSNLWINEHEHMTLLTDINLLFIWQSTIVFAYITQGYTHDDEAILRGFFSQYQPRVTKTMYYINMVTRCETLSQFCFWDGKGARNYFIGKFYVKESKTRSRNIHERVFYSLFLRVKIRVWVTISVRVCFGVSFRLE